MPISNNLKNVRNEKHCYQKDVALATGICPRSISNIERGEYYPSLETALRMAKYFKVPVEELFILTEE